MTMPTDLALMQIQAATLFAHNAHQRLVCVNEPVASEDSPAPLLFIGSTNEGAVYRFRHDLPNKLCYELETMIPHSGRQSLAADQTLFDEFAQHLQTNGYHISQRWAGPAYHFPTTIPNAPEATTITESNAAALQKHFPYTFAHLQWLQPCAAIIIEGNAVSICRTVRRSPQAAEAGVDTIPTRQQRGYGTKVVAKWGQLVQKMGITPLYSTASDNMASQKLAANLGLRQYGLDFHLSS